MKISRDWLSDFIDLGKLSNEDIAERLTSIGHAVEGVEQHGEDTIFEIEFTTNRVDAMSHLGLARELGAATGRALIEPSYGMLSVSPEGRSVAIRIDAPHMCSRYSAAVVRGVTIGPSSERVRTRLEAVGMRPINNVVDATNYVMLATGHPLHAFDLGKLVGGAVIVRGGIEGETITTLDGQSRTIGGQTIVISDAERAVALGGVMGGANSEVGPETTELLLECAWFNPPMIRRTARRLGMKSDASYRFERGVDPSDTLRALSMTLEMIRAEAGGTLDEAIDVIAEPRPHRAILLRDEVIRSATADQVDREKAVDILKSLGMAVIDAEGGVEVEIPSWRSDLSEEMDLIEELLRMHGYNAIPAALPTVPTGDVRHNPVAEAEEKLRDDLVAAGLAEVVTYAFVHPEWNAAFSDEKPLDLTNALNENISSMRLSPLPGLLQVAQYNRAYGTRDGAIFEVGRIYRPKGEGVEECSTAAFLLFGNQPASWGETRRPWSYFDAKGIVERIAAKYRIEIESAPHTGRWMANGGVFRTPGGAILASVGTVRRELLDRFELKGEIIACDIDLHILASDERGPRMRKVSRYPGVPMVLAMMHGPELTFGEIVAAVRKIEIPDLRDVGLWDRFVAPGSTEVKTAIGLWYQSDERSLTQDEVTQSHTTLAEGLSRRLGVRILKS